MILISAAWAVPVMLEHFDGGALPDGWKVTSGKAKPVVNGALTIESNDSKLVTVGKRIELRGTEWIKVSAKVTAEGGTTHCGLYFKYETVEEAWTCTPGTRDVVRYVRVPDKGWMVEVGAALDGKGKVTIDDVSVEAAAPDWKTTQRGRFTAYALDSSFPESQLTSNEETLSKVDVFFGAQTPAVAWWWYGSADVLEQYTGRRDDHVVGATVHSVWRGRTREMVKVAMNAAWGAAPEPLAIGVEAHLDGEVDDKDLRIGARGLKSRGELPTVATILDPAKLDALDDTTAGLAAGAFVRWMVEVKGMDALKVLAKGGAAPADADAAFGAWL